MGRRRPQRRAHDRTRRQAARPLRRRGARPGRRRRPRTRPSRSRRARAALRRGAARSRQAGARRSRARAPRARLRGHPARPGPVRPPPESTVTINIADALRGLGLCASREALDALLAHATKSRLSPAEVVEHIVRLERRERDARNLASRTKRATLGAMKSLDLFDWSFPRSIDRPLYEQLLSLDFTARGHNVLLRGPSGTGKSTLAQNLGQRSLEKGKSVCFSTVNSALADLLKQESMPAVDRRMRRYTAPDVLILDELGYLPCDARSGDLLFSIISRRHERASTVITTNLAFKNWGTVFPGAACVVALIDRFAQHCHVFNIDGDSWRQRPEPDPPAPLSPAHEKKKRRAA